MTVSERRLGIQWVAATIVGWLIGFALCEALQSFVSTVLVDGLVIGSAVGIAQWLVLRRWISPVGWWVVLSIVGFGVGKAVAEALLPGATTLPGYALTGGIIGVVVGLAQWVVLNRSLTAAGWWVPATGVAWAVGWSAIGVAEHAADWPTLAVYAVGGVGAAAAGLVTAITLIWLMRIPHATGPSKPSGTTPTEVAGEAGHTASLIDERGHGPHLRRSSRWPSWPSGSSPRGDPRARRAMAPQRPFAYPVAVSLSQSEPALLFWM